MARRRRGFKAPKVSFIMFQDIMTAVTGILILIVILQIIQVNDAPAKTTDAATASPDQRAELQQVLDQLQKIEAESATLREQLRDNDQSGTALSPISNSELQSEIERDKQTLQLIQDSLAKQKQKEVEQDTAVGLSQDEQKLSASQQELEAAKDNEAALEDKAKGLQSHLQSLEIHLKNAEELQKRLYLIPDGAMTSKEPIVTVVSKSGIEFSRFNRPDKPTNVTDVEDTDAMRQAIDRFSSQDQYFVFYIKPSGVALFNKLSQIARDKGFDVGFDAIEEDQQIVIAQPPASTDSTLPPPVPIPETQQGHSQTENGLPVGTAPLPGTAGTAGSPAQANSTTSDVPPSAAIPASSTSPQDSATNNAPPQQEAASPSTPSAQPQKPDEASSPGGNQARSASSNISSSSSDELPWILLLILVVVGGILAFFFVRNK